MPSSIESGGGSRPSETWKEETELFKLQEEMEALKGSEKEEDKEYLQELIVKTEKIKERMDELKELKDEAKYAAISESLLQETKDQEGKAEKLEEEGIKAILKELQRINDSPEAERARYAGKISALKRVMMDTVLPNIENIIYEKKDKLDKEELTEEQYQSKNIVLSEILEKAQGLCSYEDLNQLEENLKELNKIQEKLEDKGIKEILKNIFKRIYSKLKGVFESSES